MRGGGVAGISEIAPVGNVAENESETVSALADMDSKDIVSDTVREMILGNDLFIDAAAVIVAVGNRRYGTYTGSVVFQ